MFPLSACAALIFTVATPPVAQSARPPALNVARAVQAHYDTVRDFTAEFTHTYVGGILRNLSNLLGQTFENVRDLNKYRKQALAAA